MLRFILIFVLSRFSQTKFIAWVHSNYQCLTSNASKNKIIYKTSTLSCLINSTDFTYTATAYSRHVHGAALQPISYGVIFKISDRPTFHPSPNLWLHVQLCRLELFLHVYRSKIFLINRQIMKCIVFCLLGVYRLWACLQFMWNIRLPLKLITGVQKL